MNKLNFPLGRNAVGVENSREVARYWLIGPKREGVDAKLGVLGIMQYGRRSRFITKIRLQKYYDRVQLSLNPDNMGKSLTRKWRGFGPKIINSPFRQKVNNPAQGAYSSSMRSVKSRARRKICTPNSGCRST